MAKAPSTQPGSSEHLLCILGAWCLPGLGHILAGDRQRGLILMVAMVSLYLAGLLIGGIDVVDRREDTLWYAAQVMAGPVTLAVDRIHQQFKLDALEKQRQPGAGRKRIYDLTTYTVSVGRVNEMGTLYCALAGMLNLLVIIDLAWSSPRRANPDAPQPVLRGRVITRELRS